MFSNLTKAKDWRARLRESYHVSLNNITTAQLRLDKVRDKTSKNFTMKRVWAAQLAFIPPAEAINPPRHSPRSTPAHSHESTMLATLSCSCFQQQFFNMSSRHRGPVQVQVYGEGWAGQQKKTLLNGVAVEQSTCRAEAHMHR